MGDSLGVLGEALSMGDILQHKYTISVEGFGGDDARVWDLQSSRSLLLRLPPVCLDWLQYTVEMPWEHYVEVARDLSDLTAILSRLDADEDMARSIADRGRNFSREARSLPMTWYSFFYLVL